MDTFYRGLAAPQRSFALGRPDIDGAARPGAILAALVGEALAAGAFEPRRRPEPSAPVTRPASARPAYVERRDYGAFEDDDVVMDHVGR